MTPIQKLCIASACWGIVIGGVTVALCYEENKKSERMCELETENHRLKVDKRILQDKIRALQESDDTEESEDE